MSEHNEFVPYFAQTNKNVNDSVSDTESLLSDEYDLDEDAHTGMVMNTAGSQLKDNGASVSIQRSKAPPGPHTNKSPPAVSGAGIKAKKPSAKQGPGKHGKPKGPSDAQGPAPAARQAAETNHPHPSANAKRHAHNFGWRKTKYTGFFRQLKGDWVKGTAEKKGHWKYNWSGGKGMRQVKKHDIGKLKTFIWKHELAKFQERPNNKDDVYAKIDALNKWCEAMTGFSRDYYVAHYAQIQKEGKTRVNPATAPESFEVVKNKHISNHSTEEAVKAYQLRKKEAIERIQKTKVHQRRITAMKKSVEKTKKQLEEIFLKRRQNGSNAKAQQPKPNNAQRGDRGLSDALLDG